MFKQMIKDWFNFESATKEDYGDVTVDMARANYKEYENGIKQQQQNYIKELCEDIKVQARSGRLSIRTLYTRENDFMTDNFLQELIPYFTSRGFKVKEEPSYINPYRNHLRISWEE